MNHAPTRTGTVYDAMGGREAVTRLAEAWHSRVMVDPIVSHAFSHGFHPEHTERLAAYLAESLGGPREFTESVSQHVDVVRLHAGNGVHVEMDERGEAAFAKALVDVGIPDDVQATLRDYWHWATGLMGAHPDSAEDVPADLPLPVWTWDGPVLREDAP